MCHLDVEGAEGVEVLLHAREQHLPKVDTIHFNRHLMRHSSKSAAPTLSGPSSVNPRTREREKERERERVCVCARERQRGISSATTRETALAESCHG